MCAHRGHELLPCGSATTKRAVVCPYHGWRYGLDGRLDNAPGYEAFASFDPADRGLTPLRVREWHGYVFVDLTGTAPNLDTHLGAVEQRIAPYTPERLQVAVSHEYVVEANWKVISENYPGLPGELARTVDYIQVFPNLLLSLRNDSPGPAQPPHPRSHPKGL